MPVFPSEILMESSGQVGPILVSVRNEDLRKVRPSSHKDQT
jgi:hypothetical protein